MSVSLDEDAGVLTRFGESAIVFAMDRVAELADRPALPGPAYGLDEPVEIVHDGKR